MGIFAGNFLKIFLGTIISAKSIYRLLKGLDSNYWMVESSFLVLSASKKSFLKHSFTIYYMQKFFSACLYSWNVFLAFKSKRNL